MIYRRFGRTRIEMPVFSCGGMRYQQAWKDMPLDQVASDKQANLEATIRRSLEVGINHIETARGYGSSERQLGVILPGLPREKMTVQTKVGPCDDPAKFTADFEDSLRRLRLEYVDLLAIHGINNPATAEQSLRTGGCLAAARELQRRGLARHIGFSTHGPLDVILRCIRHEADGGFDYVNLHWYYINQNNWPAVVEARARDMGVFIISPSDKGGKLYDPPAKLVELCRPLHPIVFNDLFCLSHPDVHTLSIGAARPGDFDRHLETLPLLDRAHEVLPPIVERLQRTLVETVGEKLADPFKLGLPDWEQTPGRINLPLILWMRNLALAYDMVAYAKMRYNLLGNGGHWFPGINAEKADELDLGEATAKMPAGTDLLAILRDTHALLYEKPVQRLSKSE